MYIYKEICLTDIGNTSGVALPQGNKSTGRGQVLLMPLVKGTAFVMLVLQQSLASFFWFGDSLAGSY